MALVLPTFPGAGGSTPAPAPAVETVMELDFTSTDITNVDISAIDSFASGGEAHTIYRADGTTVMTTLIHMHTTGTPPEVTANVVNGTGIVVSEFTLGGATDNQCLSFPVTGSVSPDEDMVMVEFIIADVTFGKNLDTLFVAVADSASFVSDPSYGLDIQRINATTTEIKAARRRSSGSAIKSAFKSEGINSDYYFQIIFNELGAIVYEDNSIAYQDPRAPTNFVAQPGTYTNAANYPYAPVWTNPHILVFSLLDGAAHQVCTYTIKKLRVSKWTPAA